MLSFESCRRLNFCFLLVLRRLHVKFLLSSDKSNKRDKLSKRALKLLLLLFEIEHRIFQNHCQKNFKWARLDSRSSCLSPTFYMSLINKLNKLNKLSPNVQFIEFFETGTLFKTPCLPSSIRYFPIDLQHSSLT